MARQETTYESDLNLKATELRLGLPGSDEPGKELAAGCGKNNKRCLTDDSGSSENSSVSDARNKDCSPPSKAQVVGWPPIRSYRKNSLQAKKSDQVDGTGMYLKVSMDGAPYLRKIDLNTYKSYSDLLQGLQNMFKVQIGQSLEKEGYKGSDFAPTYEDKDGDWMLVGDVPWDMFIGSCKRLRIMKSSDAKGLGSWV